MNEGNMPGLDFMSKFQVTPPKTRTLTRMRRS